MNLDKKAEVHLMKAYSLAEETKTRMRDWAVAHLLEVQRSNSTSEDFWREWDDNWFLYFCIDADVQWHCSAVHKNHRCDDGEIFEYIDINLGDEL